MEDQEIELISNSRDVIQVATVLQQFIKNNNNTFVFPNLCINNRRAVLWTALFQLMQNKASDAIHPLCLAALRVLSRDKTDLDNVMCEKWITILTERAGLYNFVSIDDETMINIEMPPKEIAVEALKCLCNIAFNSEHARALCASTSVAQGLVARLRVYKEIPYKDDIILFDMKLLFILTALRPDIKKLIKQELHGMDYLTSCLKELVTEATVPEEEIGACAHGMIQGGFNCNLNDSQHAIACEILKTQFNLIMNIGLDESSEEDEATYLKLIPVLTALLHANCSSVDKIMDLHNNITNLLTSIPQVFFPYLTPELDVGEDAPHQCEGRNMDVLHKLLELLQYKLSITKSTKNQYEELSPILTVLNKGCRGCRAQRKYLRQTILPPLRDVSRPPEKGNTLRNQLCRFLTTPVTSVRDLVAELLFILCKEKVARFVKYTGFGNAAGHLAQKGLLAGSRSSSQYSSSSEDSDTEEYLQAQPNIDPVMGCTRPKPSNPFEGMTEEQKEYEAMKLVKLFDRLLTDGSVKPARIGPDGRPQPVQHVLEFREHAKDIPHS